MALVRSAPGDDEVQATVVHCLNRLAGRCGLSALPRSGLPGVSLPIPCDPSRLVSSALPVCVVPVVDGYVSEGTSAAPQAIPVADHSLIAAGIASWADSVHVLAIGLDPFRFGYRFAWHQRN